MHSREPVPNVQKGVGRLKLRIDLKIITVILIFLFTGQLKGYCVIMFFCFLHELGHIIVANFFKMKVEKIEILPCGFSSTFSVKLILNSKNYELKKILVALGGPIVSLMLVILSQYVKFYGITQQEAMYSNLLILLFNLLPLYPLDGGRILKGILNMKLGNIKAEYIVDKISSITIILVTIISSIAVYYFKNVAIFLVCIFLWNIILGDEFKRNFQLNSIKNKKERKALIFYGENSKI